MTRNTESRTFRIAKPVIYPVKGASAVPCEAITMGPRGLYADREWMLVHASGDRAGRFVSQRDRGCQKLARLEAIPAPGDELALYDGQGHRVIVPAPDPGAQSPVTIWKSSVTALDCGDLAARFLSEFLDMPVRLVKRSDADHDRPVDPAFAGDGAHQVVFADGYPLLVTSTASLDALNGAIDGAAIPMSRFRPNLVIEGLDAWEEDVLHELEVGTARIALVRPCTRCVVTTIDQETGEKQNNDPLSTLSRLRKGKGTDANGASLQGVFFGMNGVVLKPGTVSEGDTVKVISRRRMHPAVTAAKLHFGA